MGSRPSHSSSGEAFEVVRPLVCAEHVRRPHLRPARRAAQVDDTRVTRPGTTGSGMVTRSPAPGISIWSWYAPGKRSTPPT